MKKSDLIKLYNSYFVKDNKPGRIVYDQLMVSANDMCPFCGGIGRPRNLDHYLPKAHYPQLSILPLNLIPACRDCNMDGKGENFASTEEEQVIQPYLDDNRYFNEQWIFANYIEATIDEPAAIQYFVQPPQHWEDSHKRRVEKHFHDFNLALRFAKEAGARLVTLIPQIEGLTNFGLNGEDIKNTLIRPAIRSTLFINHWERVMLLALLDAL